MRFKHCMKNQILQISMDSFENIKTGEGQWLNYLHSKFVVKIKKFLNYI